MGMIRHESLVMSNHDLLRPCETWLRTGSPRDGRLLVGRGIVPNDTIGEKFVQ